MLTQFSRTELLLGKEAMNKLKNSRVAVFGIGGVGGYVCEAALKKTDLPASESGSRWYSIPSQGLCASLLKSFLLKPSSGKTFPSALLHLHSGFSHIQKNKNIFLPAFHDISACIRCRSLPSLRIRLRCTEHISQNVIN